ncbi:MAG: hypothetical protein PV344_08610, partial [Anaplasma sp.]|nr:hypothetical protein [Anaplasma sp.]
MLTYCRNCSRDLFFAKIRSSRKFSHLQYAHWCYLCYHAHWCSSILAKVLSSPKVGFTSVIKLPL